MESFQRTSELLPVENYTNETVANTNGSEMKINYNVLGSKEFPKFNAPKKHEI